MRPIISIFLAASSFLLSAGANAAIRPHYGGTLHIAVRAAPLSLDPLDAGQADWFGSRNVLDLIFETLITLDEQGKAKPALAASWQAEPGNQRWQLNLRRGVAFQDGTALTAEVVAASLRKANPTWKVLAAGEAVIIERDSPAAELPAELALLRNSIAKRDSGRIAGTGPFAISQWDPGKKLTLRTREVYWGGRPFVDSVEIEFDKSFRDQMILFDAGRAQMIEIPPEQTHRAAAESSQIESSAPMGLVALVLAREPQSPEDARQRHALSLCLDRELMNHVLLQDAGEPAGGLLPNWISGYSFLFKVAANLTAAQQERAQIPIAAAWTLGVDSNDPIERVLAERIVLNARDAGLRLQVTAGTMADIRMARIPLRSIDAAVALTELAAELSLPQPKIASDSPEDLYAAENALLQSQRVIPLLHLRTATGVSSQIKNWSQSRTGEWHLGDVSLAADKP